LSGKHRSERLQFLLPGALICQQLIHWLNQSHQQIAAGQRLEKLSVALREMAARAYDKLNPAPRLAADLKDVLEQLAAGPDNNSVLIAAMKPGMRWICSVFGWPPKKLNLN
jgi:hypothetical protein